METPSFIEDHISQIPALHFLQKLGYTYLTPDEAMTCRGGKTSNVLLEDILRRQLEKINSITYKGNNFGFSAANIQAGIQALRDLPMNEGYIAACEYVYNLITLGKAFEQSIDGDKKSFTLQYIDWNPDTFLTNNVFHVTEEYSVMKATSRDHYRPDIVLFVNGIPLSIIECKQPGKDMLHQAISQHLRNQQEDGIRSLYVYAQNIMSIAYNEALYATNGTQENFWARWQEKFQSKEEELRYKGELRRLKNQTLSKAQKDKLYNERFNYVQQYFDAMEQEDMMPTVQDEYLYGLCRPSRLLDFAFNFIVFDDGEKKIARYQQYFAIKKVIDRIHISSEGRRKGGVIWHTQGSGKSLTMVMLAQAIALDKSIKNPKIILVTDRVDLDDQITGTFRKCGKYVTNATTGQKLVELLESKSDAVVTTIINKFEAAVNKAKQPFESRDIFVLIDEGHRTQYGTFNVKMQKTLPNACFIAMTGTPLLHKEKNTAGKFGGIIDAYPVDVAVRDKAVVPILYEGRHAIQKVNETPIDNFFSMISEPLNEYQKVDLKKKFSRADQLNLAEQKIYAVAWDISLHFRDNWQGTEFKGQLVCQNKIAAIKYKNYLDEIGIVSSEVLISPPDEREGEDSAYAQSTELVNIFWKKMLNEHGTAKNYETNIIKRFKKQPKPEIIIVVDKLTTGFDAPINTILYLTRSLKEHKLLQTIARVNRVYEGKDFGYVIDYSGVLTELDEALRNYSSFEDFDIDDLKGTITNIADEIKKLPQKHSDLWDIFKGIRNKRDIEAFQYLLRDIAIRTIFYDRVTDFTRALKVALSSIDFYNSNEEATIERYKMDATFFLKLRKSVKDRYSDIIDYRQYESQIQKLIDKHIQTDEVRIITDLINIFDTEKFQAELEKVTGAAAKADHIASRTAKTISEKMEEDPAFYKKFSDMLKETIKAYEEQRITEAEYLSKVKSIMESVISHTDSDIPEVLRKNDIATAYYGLCHEALGTNIQDPVTVKGIATQSAQDIQAIIEKLVLDNGRPVVDWQYKSSITGKLVIEISDYLIDEVRDKYHIELSYLESEEIANRCINVSKLKYK